MLGIQRCMSKVRRYIALFKAGIDAAEELKGMVEIGKMHIEK